MCPAPPAGRRRPHRRAALRGAAGRDRPAAERHVLTDEPSILASIERLRAAGFAFDRGLTDGEIHRVQARFGVRFPPDLRFLLQTALPVSAPFPDWRSADAASLRSTFLDPITEGVLFDVRHGDLWRRDWGPRPPRIADAVAAAAEKFRAVPQLVPVCRWALGIKCVAGGDRPGTPVFSIHQSDIVHCGRDLAAFLDWLASDPRSDEPFPVFDAEYLPVPFWTDLARDNNERTTAPRLWDDVCAIYPAYAVLRDLADAAGCASQVFRPDGRFGLWFLARGARRLSFWAAERDGEWVLGLYDPPRSTYRFDGVGRVTDVCRSLLAAVRGGADPASLSDEVRRAGGVPCGPPPRPEPA